MLLLPCATLTLWMYAAAGKDDSDSVYNQTFFQSLENYQVQAKPVSESQYEWVARVVHSRTNEGPHLCTATCIAPRVFITAARCVTNVKVHYTSVFFMNSRHLVRAVVLPRHPTKQSFDDIGLLVVEPRAGRWPSIPIIAVNRTDERFKWFADLNLSYGPQDHRVIAYATPKGIHKSLSPTLKFSLYELSVVVGISMCREIFTVKFRIEGFYVPCYHSCTLHEFGSKQDKCLKYLGVEGGAVIDGKTKKLIGVATWGAYFSKYNLPVGLSVPNSESFFKNYECAMRIRDDGSEVVPTGHYQSLCPD